MYGDNKRKTMTKIAPWQDKIRYIFGNEQLREYKNSFFIDLSAVSKSDAS